MATSDVVPVYEKLHSVARDNDHELRNYGIYSLLSMRLEKSYGIWSREFSPDYTHRMCGLDSFVAYEKSNFIGRDAVLRDRDKQSTKRLVTFDINIIDADVGGYEPIWCGDQIAGFTTSGGYGHRVNKSLAMGYLQYEYFGNGRDFEISILGKRRPAVLLDAPVYDSADNKMR